MPRPKQMVSYYKQIEGRDFPIVFTFCKQHERQLARFTGVLVGSSDDDDEPTYSPPGCDVCQSKGDLGYLGYLVEYGIRIAHEQH